MTANTTAKAAPVIGLLGHTGNQNLGDEAITEATILNFKARLPNATFKLFSIHPDDTEARYQYPAYPLRPGEDATVSSVLYRNWQPVQPGDAGVGRSTAPLFERDDWDYTQVEARLPWRQRIRRLLTVVTRAPAIWMNERRFERSCLELLQDVDLLVVTGSNQFLDNYGGPWAFPFTLLRWARLAERSNTPLAFASVGAGPVYSRLSLWLLRHALKRAAYISVRDEPSRVVLEKGGFAGAVKVCPDLAFSLPDEYIVTGPLTQTGDKAVIGINPMPVYSPSYWYVSDAKLYNHYVRALAETAIWLKSQGHRFFFFATQTKDANVVDDVLKSMAESGHKVSDPQTLIRESRTVKELLEIVSTADAIVATRFHGTVLGLFANKPVLGTCYYRKAADLLNEFGYQDFVLPLETVTGEQLSTGIYGLVERSTQLVEAATPLRSQFRQALDQQYEELCALIKT